LLERFRRDKRSYFCIAHICAFALQMKKLA